MQTRAMKLIATKLETSLALEGELTDKGLSALSESSDSMSRQLAKALLEQMADTVPYGASALNPLKVCKILTWLR